MFLDIFRGQPVPEMTYTVSGGTLNPLTHYWCSILSSCLVTSAYCVYAALSALSAAAAVDDDDE